ncbi:MAG: hypothetical protein IKA87_01300 [Lentisphaeria bacterium]|nr:hypothetical protein [Lentisphaeria bacterium]
MFKIGCGEKVLEVPRFAELYGYGPFCGRRSAGTADPLYCRVVIFDDGKKQNVLVITDTCITCDRYARELRADLAEICRLDPSGIAFAATHTHSAPLLSTAGSIGCGEAHPEFQKIFYRTVREAAAAALADREEISSADSGIVELKSKLGSNRVTVEENNTDPFIRFARFYRPDGSVKLLMHNHGMHGIAFNGKALWNLVSADWMGAVNSLLVEKGLCTTPVYLQGAGGNINTASSCASAENDDEHKRIAAAYAAELEAGFRYARPLALDTLKCQISTVEFPVVEQSAAELRADAAKLRTMKNPYWWKNADRLDEMAVLLDRGINLRSYHDLQYFRIGDLGIFFIPGELYIEPGLELYERSGSAFTFISAVSNGDGEYIFTPENADRFTDILPPEKGGIFGYYEIYDYMSKHRFKYQSNIAGFIIKNALKLEEMCK